MSGPPTKRRQLHAAQDAELHVCSFCGWLKSETIQGPAVRLCICGECAETALNMVRKLRLERLTRALRKGDSDHAP